MKVAYVRLSLSVILLNAFVEWKLAKGNLILIFLSWKSHVIRVPLKNKHFLAPDTHTHMCVLGAKNVGFWPTITLQRELLFMLLPVLLLFKENEFDEIQLIQSN